MTTYWCTWCGATAEAESPDERRSCRRCARELWGLFGYPPRAEMTPLAPGEKPGMPVGSRKQFVFTDPANGEEIGRTEPIRPAQKRVKRGRSERPRRVS